MWPQSCIRKTPRTHTLKLIAFCSLTWVALAAQTAEPVKIAFYNIRAGQGIGIVAALR